MWDQQVLAVSSANLPISAQAIIDTKHNVTFMLQDAEFINREKKVMLKCEKALALETTVLKLDTWLKNIRTRYGKPKKKKSGQAARLSARCAWILNRFVLGQAHPSSASTKPWPAHHRRKQAA
jgi:hypothetical protein